MIHMRLTGIYGMGAVALLLALALATPGLLVHPANDAQAAGNGATEVIGESVEGRPIEVYRIGNGPRSIVLVGAIHGDEGNSAVLVEYLSNFFDNSLHLLPPDVSLYFVPVLNPDGLAVNSRYNTNGVDLNRNWAASDWQPDSSDASGRVRGGGGSRPFSEPETAAIAGWLAWLRDNSHSVTAIFYHSQYPPNGLVLGGSVGRPYTPAYADVVGYPTIGGGPGNVPSWGAYPVTGDAPSWCGENGMGCFEIELPSRRNLNAAQSQQHAAAVLGVFVWQQAMRNQICFTETGACVSGRMKEFWLEHGGLAVFGMPITPQRERLVDGTPRQTQWFERNRLELHPANPRPYDVLSGRIGAERLEQQQRSWYTFVKADPAMAESPDCRYFAETGHAVCGEFLQAWRARGLESDGRAGFSEDENLALFGMPLSMPQTEVLEDGSERTVQWFERARLEQHGPGTVLLGLLGTETWRVVQVAEADTPDAATPAGPGYTVQEAVEVTPR